MRRKFSISTRNRNRIYLALLFGLFCSCAHNSTQQAQEIERKNLKTFRVQCVEGDNWITYEVGDLPCIRETIQVGKNEKLKIIFRVLNEKSEDPYEYGIQELLRIKNGKTIEVVKMRRDDDAYWSIVPFVRIREQRYLADLDGDGYQEFAVFPFSPGSAIWGTARIFSLKEKIEFWGEGRIQFEGDTFVQLGCMSCSKFNPEACKKCR